MKKTLLALGFSFLSIAGFAQGNSSEKGILTLQLGGAIPTGDFGDNSLTNEKAGFAKTGGYFGLEYTRFINKYFGIGAALGYRQNAFDTDEMNKTLNAMYTAFGMTPEKITATNWTTVSYMVNAVGKYPITDNFTAYAKVGVGFASSATPETTVAGMTTKSVSGSGLATNFGIGARYSFGKFAAGVEVLTLGTKPEFKQEDVKTTQQMNSVNTNLTLSYLFK